MRQVTLRACEDARQVVGVFQEPVALGADAVIVLVTELKTLPQPEQQVGWGERGGLSRLPGALLELNHWCLNGLGVNGRGRSFGIGGNQAARREHQ